MYRQTGTTGIVGCGQATMSASAQTTAYTSQSPTDSAHEPLWALPICFAFPVTEFLKSHCVYREYKSYVQRVSNIRFGSA